MLQKDELNNLCKNTLIDNLGIVFTGAGNKFIEGEMPVDKRTVQPFGRLHGGALLAFAETLGSAGSLIDLDLTRFSVVGISVTANHVRGAREGKIRGIGELIHKGTKTHVWNINMFDENQNLLSTARVTNMLITKSEI